MSRIVNQRYTLLRLLGRGGMGEVFLAADSERPGALVALKYLAGRAAEAGAEALRGEFRRLSRLRHPHLVQVFDLETDRERGEPFLCMEYIEGSDLLSACRGVPLATLVDLTVQACLALEYLHSQGIVHRDLKPENLLVSPPAEAGGRPWLRILDFGLSEDAIPGTDAAVSPRLGGTPAYMAPEQFRGGWVDHRADLYSLGVLLYQALAGRLPFEAEDPSALVRAHLEEEPPPPGRQRPGLDPAVEAIVLRLLRKRPAERYQSARQVVEALRMLTTAGIEAAPGPPARSPRLVGRAAVLERLDRLTRALVAADPPAGPLRLLLGGPAGCGKSRLVEEARTLARSRGIEVVRVDREEAAAGPFLLLDRVRGALEAARQRPPAPLPQPQEVPPSAGTSGDAAGPRPADRLWAAIRDLAGCSPLLILIEDLHAADADSLRALAEFLRVEERVRAALLATSREPLPALSAALAEEWSREGTGWEIPLEPLDDAEVSALLASLLGASPDSPVPEPLLRRAAGNPLFAVEWARALCDRGLLRIRDGRLVLDEAALASLPAPPGLVALARLRLEELTEPALRLAAALAALDRPVPPAEAAAVAEIDAAALDAAVAEAARRGLLAGDGAAEGGDAGAAPLALAHASLRDAVRELIGDRFAPFQARAALRLEEGGAARAAELALRWRLAGDPTRMRAWAVRAADEAQAAGAWEQEMALLEWTLEATPRDDSAERVRLLRRLASAPIEAGAWVRARPVLARLQSEAEAARDAGALLDALAKDHTCCVWLHEFEEASRREARIRDLLRERPDPFFEAKLERTLAQRSAAAGDLDGALAHARRAGDRFRSLGRPVEAALCLSNFASYLLGVRDPGEPEALLREAESLLLEAGDTAHLVFPRLNLALAAIERGEWADAEERLRAGIEELRALRRHDLLPKACLELAAARERGGRIDRALQDYEEAADLARRHGQPSTRLHALERHGALLRLLGLGERAAAIHSEGLAAARRLRLPLQEAFLAAALAEDRAAAGDGAGAEDLAAAARAIAARLGHSRAGVRAALAQARSALARGDADAATALLETCRSLIDPAHQRPDAAHLEALEARSALRRGERARAAAAIARGLEHARLGSLAAEEAELRALRLEAGLAADTRGEAEALEGALARLTRHVTDPAVGRLARLAPAWRSGLERLAGAAGEPGGAREEVPLGEREALRALADLGRTIETLDDPRQLAVTLLERARALVGAGRALLVLTDPQGGGARAAASSGLPPDGEPEALEFSRAALAQGLEAPLLVLEAERDPRLAGSRSVERFGIRSVACVPLRLRGVLLGALYLDSRERVLEAGSGHLRFLEAFAHQAAAALDSARAFETLRGERERLRGRVLERYRFHSLLGRSPAMQQIYDLLEPFSKSDLPVLITGESGTGKELVARALHFNGPRRDGPFVAESCAAIPDTLLESELFGHVRGAFTGAERDRRGVFLEASGGTLLLDEIGEMGPHLQAKLLRALQEKEVRPLGSARSLTIDARIVAATHRDLAAAVRSGAFREDLLYRLRVLTLHLPPLRERLEDLPMLARHFLAEHRREHGRGPADLAPGVLERLEGYPWPGNVRELRGETLKMALVAEGERVEARDVESHPELFGSLLRPGRPSARPQPGTLRDVERRQMERALRAARGDKQKAARLLGLSRATFYRKLRRYGIAAAPGT